MHAEPDGTPGAKREAAPLRIAIISDVHANSGALSAALAAARARGFDRLVILGDLLSYGCHPLEVLELAGQAASAHEAIFIKGNHDQLYIDLMRGDDSYFSGLPAWLQETAAWTHDALKGRDIESMFAWQNNVIFGDTFFSHANPFAHGDWTYLNRPEEIERAARRLKTRKQSLGVFGHTHRPKVVEFDNSGASRIHHVVLDEPIKRFALRKSDNPKIIDVGAVGQPRSQDKSSKMAILTTEGDDVQVDFIRLDYDFAAHAEAIHRSTLSEPTRKKLLGFFS
jgi:predicted phosphodiesterase